VGIYIVCGLYTGFPESGFSALSCLPLHTVAGKLNHTSVSLLLLQSLTSNAVRPASFCSATTTLGLLSDCCTRPAPFRPNLLSLEQRRFDSTMASSAASTSSERTQRSPLASQRTGGTGGHARFPLGYKEGFSQWVRMGRCASAHPIARGDLLTLMGGVGEHFTSSGGAYRSFAHPISTAAFQPHSDWILSSVDEQPSSIYAGWGHTPHVADDSQLGD
jgi:hypothetical protein